jgi:hypothetical protein
MRHLFWLVIALVAAPVPVLQAAAPGVPPSKVMAGPAKERRRLDAGLPESVRLRDLIPFAQRPQIRLSPNGTIVFATDEEHRRIEEKREKERRRLEEGAKRWKQMEQQIAQRRAEKGRNALIALAIGGGVLLLRFLVWLARLGQ